jgi:two-component system, LuxR family, sensor kinase FixL
VEQDSALVREYLHQSIMLDADEDLYPLGYLEIMFYPARIELSPIGMEMLSWGVAGASSFKASQLLQLQILNRATRLRKLRAAIADGKDGGMISVIVTHPNGQRRQLRAAFRVKRNAGKLISWQAVLIDDTDMRRREAELRATLSTVPSAMIVIDCEGIMRSFSAAAVAMFGYTEEYAVGKRIDLLMPDPHRSQHSSYLERYVSTGKAKIIGRAQTLNALRADGTEFPIELWVGDASTESEKLFAGFISDQTERIETEAKLQSLQNDLVHVSRLSAVSELSLSLAHELNQPLSAIVNYLSIAEFIAAGNQNIENKQLLMAIRNGNVQAMRAGEIIKRLRTYVEKGEADMCIEQIGPIIRESISLIALTIQRKGIALEISIEHEMLTVLGDRIQLQQVLFNLMRNAIESLEEVDQNQRKLSIGTRAVGNDNIEISVEDNGLGVPPEHLPSLFKPFSSQKSDGMGVGLSICRRIIESHGGEIHHAAKRSRGACFLITLPLVSTEPIYG